MAIQVLLNINYKPLGLIVDGGKLRLPVQQKAIDTDCYDSVLSLHQLNQRQEYLEGDPQPWNKQQSRMLAIAVCVECHLCLFSDLGDLQLPAEVVFAA